MERRSKTRLDLQLVCYVAPGTVLSRVRSELTGNVSRDGMLLQWDGNVPPPPEGSPLVVEVELPEGVGIRRMMRCNTTVVRAEKTRVALRIERIRFVDGSRHIASTQPASEAVN